MYTLLVRKSAYKKQHQRSFKTRKNEANKRVGLVVLCFVRCFKSVDFDNGKAFQLIKSLPAHKNNHKW